VCAWINRLTRSFFLTGSGLPLCDSRIDFEEMGDGSDAAVEIRQMQEFIRCVSVLVRQSESQKNRVDFQDPLELHDDGDGSPSR